MFPDLIENKISFYLWKIKVKNLNNQYFKNISREDVFRYVLPPRREYYTSLLSVGLWINYNHRFGSAFIIDIKGSRYINTYNKNKLVTLPKNYWYTSGCNDLTKFK
tara:strand:+ start:8 stop:325 length:318 start_codon:yes stop_codon:yes gene_type:complete